MQTDKADFLLFPDILRHQVHQFSIGNFSFYGHWALIRWRRNQDAQILRTISTVGIGILTKNFDRYLLPVANKVAVR